MKKLIILFISFFVIVISGCISSEVPMSVASDISDNLTSYQLKFWNGYAEATNRQLFFEEYIKLGVEPNINRVERVIVDFDLCPVRDYTNPDDKVLGDTKVYYLNECDFSKINAMKNSDNSSQQMAYVGFSIHKSDSLVAQGINSTFNEIYSKEDKSSRDAVVVNIVDKVYDISSMVPLLASEGWSWGYAVQKIYACNKSTSCISSFLNKLDGATATLTQEISFGDNFISFCEKQIKNTKEYNQALDQIKKIFREKGYDVNLDKYNINAKSICQRNNEVYSSIYEKSLNKVSEPTQKFFIAATFYSLNKGMSQTSLTDYLNRLVA